MKHRFGLIAFAIILAVLSAYYLSLSFITGSVEKDAETRATNSEGVLDESLKRQYLDSVKTEVILNLGVVQYTYQDIKEKEIHLGLDLQGGMHVTLEVSPVEIIKAMANYSKDPDFNKALSEAVESQKSSQEPFLKLFKKAYDSYGKEDNSLVKIFKNKTTSNRINKESTNADVYSLLSDEVEQSIDRAYEILSKRIDKFGLVQPIIQRIPGTGRIQMELPGVDNPERIRKLVQGVAKLEFVKVYRPSEFLPLMTPINDFLVAEEKAKSGDKSTSSDEITSVEPVADEPEIASVEDSTDSNVLDTNSLAANDTTGAAKDTSMNNVSSLFKMNKGGYFLRFSVSDTPKVNRIFARKEVKKMLPKGLELAWEKGASYDKENNTIELVPLNRGRDGKAQLEGDVITDAYIEFPNGTRPVVAMSMNAKGAREWEKLTSWAAEDYQGESVNNKRIAVVLDGMVYSAPSCKEPIAGGRSQISGNFDIDEAKDLANILKAGKLPAPTRIVEEAIVGPSLGKEAIRNGLISCLVGLALVIVFMIMYYGKGGLISDLALLLNVFFIIGVLVQFGAVLTLPGIAGIVLTLGMAVDANVLIFERIREELATGKSLINSINIGYEKAFSTILDANVTTFITSFILMILGSGTIQGFATTLLIGVLCSFFTAIYLTKEVIVFIINRSENAAINFETSLSKGFFKNLNIGVINKRKTAYTFSGVVIIVGFACLVIQGGLNLGTDFKGGRSYIVEFPESVVSSDLKTSLSNAFGGKGTEVKSFGSTKVMKITTSYLIEDESDESDANVKAAMDAGLKGLNLDYKIIGSSKVGATIADDIIVNSMYALFFALIGIFGYIAIRFRDWRYGLGAIIALIHDTLIVVGLYAVADLVGLNYEVDQIFVAAVLTVIGFSINDTVVVFDRVREFRELYPKMNLSEVMNNAINSTFSRTTITSITMLLVVVVLLVFGGEVLKGFSFVLLLGVLFGTYSSIFIALPIVLDILKGKKEVTE